MKRTLTALFLFCSLYVAGRLAILRWRRLDHSYWLVSLTFCFVLFLAIVEIVWSKHEFQSLQNVMASLVVSRRKGAVERWYRLCIRRMYDPRLSLLTAFSALPLLIWIQHLTNWNSWLGDTYLRRYDTIVQVVMVSAAAASQWAFANISVFVARLPRKELSINFFAHPRDSIMSLGSLLLKIDLGGVTLTFALALALYISPIAIPRVVYILLICVFLWAGAWFFLTQYAIHRCMLSEKRENLKIISARLMESLHLVRVAPTSENQKLFEDLKRLFDELDSLPEWPFRSRSVLTLATGVLVPIAVTLADLLGKR